VTNGTAHAEDPTSDPTEDGGSRGDGGSGGPAGALTAAAAAAAAGAFRAVARVRHRKPLHPRGLVVPALVERHGAAPPVGAAWVDEPGRDEGVVRLSRSAGLPAGWPDVWGLALRVAAPRATSGVADLLLGGAFAGPLGRHVLTLTRGPRAPLTTVLPYRTGTGRRVLLGALAPPDARGGEELPGARDRLAARLAAEPLRLVLAVSEPGTPWRRFGTLTVGGQAEGTGDGGDDAGSDDGRLSFDPVLNPLPGLVLPEPLATVRARAYAGARAGRRADPAGLGGMPPARLPR
jgi:hypothetical protein